MHCYVLVECGGSEHADAPQRKKGKKTITSDELRAMLSAYCEAVHHPTTCDPALIGRQGPSMAAASAKYSTGCHSTCSRYWAEHLEKVNPFIIFHVDTTHPLILYLNHNSKVEGADNEEIYRRRMEIISNLTVKRLGNADFLSQSFFSEDECIAFAATCAAFGRMGFGLNMLVFRNMLHRAARLRLQHDVDAGWRDGFVDKLTTDGGDIPHIGETFFQKYFYSS